MLAFSVQTVLLMVAAYFVGAAMACVIRRSLFARTMTVAERRVDPLPEALQRLAEPPTFGRMTRPVTPAPPPAPVPPAQSADAVTVETGPQDLKCIRQIDADTEAALREFGIERYEQIAAWKRDDVRRVDQALGAKGRVNRENWIEQAQVLSKGGETYYSARRARGEESTAVPTADEGGELSRSAEAPLPRPMSPVGVAAAVVAPSLPHAREGSAAASPPMVAERAAFATQAADRRAQPASAAPAADLAAAVPVRAVAATSDNLQRIGSITPDIERALNAQGIARFSQIAQWSASDAERVGQQFGISGRIARENWVEQAQILSRGGDTRFSREFDARGVAGDGQAANGHGDRPSKRTDLGALRSVRSEAYRGAPEPGPEAARRAAAQNKIPRPAQPHDLKRIRGIGVLIEKRLNSMGVTTYDDIANWTADDIDRVSQSLDFKGRIERENWVEQARILSAGGQTEFSRRVDRGDVETSRART